MAQLSGWSKRIKLTTDNTKVDSDQTHFPTTVFLKAGNGETTKVFDEVGANKLKIAIADDSDPAVEHYVEIEQWDTETPLGVLHFGKTGETLPSASTKDYYLYYDNTHADNTAYVGDDPDDTPSNNVWDSNFKLVYHMAELGSNPQLKDSTSNNNDTDANSSDALAAGKVNGAQDYDAAEVSSFGVTNLSPTAQVTVEACIKTDGVVTAIQGIVDRAGSQEGFYLYLNTTGKTVFSINGGFGVATGVTDVDDSIWNYLAGRYNKDEGGTKEIRVYVNGAEDGTGDYSIAIDYDPEPRHLIGQLSSSTYQFLGGIDEVRISATARSAAWIKATYNSLNDSLLTYGTEETAPSAAFQWAIII